jgi:hypothetical protein
MHGAEELGGGRMNFVFNQSGDGNTQIGSIGRGPEWVRTADRLPTAEDANNNLCVLAKVAKDGTVKEVRFEKLSWIEWGGAYYFSHWMKLPEVEG